MNATHPTDSTDEATGGDMLVAGKHRHVPTWQRAIGWTLRGLLIAVCVTAAALTIVPAALGFQRYSIGDASMGSTISKGSIVYDKAVPTTSLKVGDIITYQPPAGVVVAGDRVTERIVKMTAGLNGRTVFQTKGDGNAAVDPWSFSLSDTRQAEVSQHIPYVGYPLNWLATRAVRVGVVAAIALLIVIRLGFGIWLDASFKAKRQARAAKAATSDGASTIDASTGIGEEALAAEAENLHADSSAADVDNGGLDATRAAALAALIAASSAVASARGLIGIQGTSSEDELQQSRSRAAS
jgi:signal peptidase